MEDEGAATEDESDMEEEGVSLDATTMEGVEEGASLDGGGSD